MAIRCVKIWQSENKCVKLLQKYLSFSTVLYLTILIGENVLHFEVLLLISAFLQIKTFQRFVLGK